MQNTSTSAPHAPVFDDRRDAGTALASSLDDWVTSNPVVIGLARGGVEVADVVARSFHLPLDALAVRKVGHPWQPEYALGAVAPDGIVYLRESDGLDRQAIEIVVAAALQRAIALDRRLHTWHPALDLTAKTCILIDDGLATGATMIAACRWARSHDAARVVAAVPIGAAESIAMLEHEADCVVCPVCVPDLGAVGPWYRSFGQVEDERVIELISSRPFR
jgi:putative phosphoribosyl transferase